MHSEATGGKIIATLCMNVTVGQLRTSGVCSRALPHRKGVTIEPHQESPSDAYQQVMSRSITYAAFVICLPLFPLFVISLFGFFGGGSFTPQGLGAYFSSLAIVGLVEFGDKWIVFELAVTLSWLLYWPPLLRRLNNGELSSGAIVWRRIVAVFLGIEVLGAIAAFFVLGAM